MLLVQNVTVRRSDINFCDFAVLVLRVCWSRSYKAFKAVKLFTFNVCCFSMWSCISAYQSWSKWDHHPAELTIFITLHALHALHETRSRHKKAVCLSLRLSNAWSVTKRKKDLSRFLYEIESFNLVFREEGWLVNATPSIPEILGQADPVGAKSPIFSRYSLVAPQQ